MAQRDSAALALRTRAVRALRRPANWVQLAKFGAVGATGYVVNLAVYTALLRGAGWHYAYAATVSFLVAVTNNYLWNRIWTFRSERGHVAFQGLRFFTVALVAYGANPYRTDRSGDEQGRRPGDRDRARHAAEFRRQQALVLRPVA